MSFTEIKAEELKDNPFDLIGKQWMLITAGNEEKCNTMPAKLGWCWNYVGQADCDSLYP